MVIQYSRPIIIKVIIFGIYYYFLNLNRTQVCADMHVCMYLCIDSEMGAQSYIPNPDFISPEKPELNHSQSKFPIKVGVR